MDDQHSDASLLRPAVDPTVPRAARILLLSHGSHAGGFDLLPLEPERRLATVSGAATAIKQAGVARAREILSELGEPPR